MKNFTLAAFSAERRVVAVVLFRGSQLEETRLRHLPIDASKAAGSVRDFVIQTIERHSPEYVAISGPVDKVGDRIRGFCATVKQIAVESDIPSSEVDDRTLRSAYGHPALVRKEHVRRVGRTIWPTLKDLNAKSAAVDAATVGLYIQTERLFSLHEEAA